MLLFFNLHIWTVTTLLDAWSTLQQANEKKKMIKTRETNVNEFSHKTELSSKVLSGRQALQTKLPLSPESPGDIGMLLFPPPAQGETWGYRKGLYGEINQGLGSPGLSELSLGSCPGALPNPGLHCCIVHCALRLLSPVCTSSPSSPSSPPPPLSHCSLFPPAPPCVRICFPLSCFLPSPHPCLPLGVSVNGGRGKHKLRG